MAMNRFLTAFPLAFAMLAFACGDGVGEPGANSANTLATPTSAAEATAVPTLQPLTSSAAPPPGLSAELLADLAATTGRPASDFALVSIDSVIWPDGCLGIGKPGTVCSQALVPGWLAVFRDTGGREYRYRAGPGSWVPEE